MISRAPQPPVISTSTAVGAVVTNYNYGRFIQQAIDSLLAQTHPLAQVIVVDDGSTDNSIEVLAKYCSKIRLLKQANAGVVTARNNGAQQCQTDYLLFVDADDYLHPEYVASCLKALQLSQTAKPMTGLAYTDQQFVGQSQQVITSSPWNVKKLLYRNYLSIATLIPKSAFDYVNGFSLELNQAHSFEDWDLWLSLAEAGYEGVYIPEPLMFYRLHGAGRNMEALRHRDAMEEPLRLRHPKLYNQPINRLYVSVFRNLSQLRNKIVPPPGQPQ